MHTGAAVERGGDWFGATVNLAARVAARALGGEVLLTQASRAAAARELRERTVQHRGRHAFKNVREPVELWALLVDADRAESGLPLDPVCRMAVDPARLAHRVAHRGVEYHFCSDRCSRRFRDDPARYVERQHRDDRVLVSDRERLRAAAQLGRAHERGGLTELELEERLERARRSERCAAARRRGGPSRGPVAGAPDVGVAPARPNLREVCYVPSRCKTPNRQPTGGRRAGDPSVGANRSEWAVAQLFLREPGS